MLKNITLSADDHLIKLARIKAQEKNETLNAAFREWLVHYVKKESKSPHYFNLMKNFSYVNAGKRFSREELNER